MFKRICSNCGGEIIYKYKKSFILANRKNSICTICINTKNNENQRKYNLDFLLNDDIISAYYMGLIIADGSFYKNRFEICLKKEDGEEVLPHFAKLIGNYEIKERTIKNKSYYRIAFNNKNSIDKLMNEFGIEYNKTYNPIPFDKIKNKPILYLKSLFIGLIDGDGSIFINKDNKSPSISLIFHKNWENFYIKLMEILNIEYNLYESKNCKTLKICKTNEILKLYDFVNANIKIKINRKWDKLKMLTKV